MPTHGRTQHRIHRSGQDGGGSDRRAHRQGRLLEGRDHRLRTERIHQKTHVRDLWDQDVSDCRGGDCRNINGRCCGQTQAGTWGVRRRGHGRERRIHRPQRGRGTHRGKDEIICARQQSSQGDAQSLRHRPGRGHGIHDGRFAHACRDDRGQIHPGGRRTGRRGIRGSDGCDNRSVRKLPRVPVHGHRCHGRRRRPERYPPQGCDPPCRAVHARLGEDGARDRKAPGPAQG